MNKMINNNKNISECYCQWHLGIEEMHHGVIIIRTLGSNVDTVRKKSKVFSKIPEYITRTRKPVPHSQLPEAEAWFWDYCFLIQEEKKKRKKSNHDAFLQFQDAIDNSIQIYFYYY